MSLFPYALVSRSGLNSVCAASVKAALITLTLLISACSDDSSSSAPEINTIPVTLDVSASAFDSTTIEEPGTGVSASAASRVVEVTLTNEGTQDLNNWALFFNSLSPLDPGDDGDVISATPRPDYGSLYGFAPNNDAIKTIKAGESVQFTLNLRIFPPTPDAFFPFYRPTDAFRGAYLTYRTGIAGPERFARIADSTFDFHSETVPISKYREIAEVYRTYPIEGKLPDPDEQIAATTHLIPRPVAVTQQGGEPFPLETGMTIYPHPAIPCPDLGKWTDICNSSVDVADVFKNQLEKATGYTFVVSPSEEPPTSEPAIYLSFDPGITGAEAYRIEVEADALQVHASTTAGLFYGSQRALQLFNNGALAAIIPGSDTSTDPTSSEPWQITPVTINDAPRFGYRAFHFDIARQIQPWQRLTNLIDQLALLGFNNLVLIASDDEGWRLQSQTYPTLNSVGSWRGINLPLPPELGSGPEVYGGYFTQAQIAELVEYARARYINIIPLVNVFGHARAILKSLDQLYDPGDQSEYVSVQFYTDNVISPCRESSREVIFNLLDEVAELFPSKLIHIGSDEVPEGAWLGSPACQALMEEQGLTTQNDLHAWYINQLDEHLAAQGRYLGGWEEITEVDPAGNIIPPSTYPRQFANIWNTQDIASTAANAGYPVILTTAAHLYLDMAYNFRDGRENGLVWTKAEDHPGNDLHSFYSFDPLADGGVPYTEEGLNNIQGIQGGLFAENLINSAQTDYMLFPRLFALAETAWTQPENKNWLNFMRRMGHSTLVKTWNENGRCPRGEDYQTCDGPIVTGRELLKKTNYYSERYPEFDQLPKP